MPVALANPYCTRDELVHELKMNKAEVDASTTLIDELHEAINNASRWIDDYQKRDYFLHDHSSTTLDLDEAFPDVFDETLFLPYAPIIVLTEVKLNGAVLVLNTDFIVRTYENGVGLIKLDGPWNLSRRYNLCQIKGKFGYDQASAAVVPTALPGKINLACRLVAAALSGHNRKEVAGLDGQKTEISSNNIPKTVFDLLGRKKSILV